MRRVECHRFIGTVVFFIVLCITGEILARYVLGLGSPPLSVQHPRIEYIFKPNQDLYRFGNHFVVNQYGMRTEPFSALKEPGELRLMCFGDSVLNGGSQTDQADLATNLVKDRLVSKGYENVIVGNISAGSWGPGNWLAYAKEYGFFDADIIVLVVSSHDHVDIPAFQPLDKNTHPTEKPVSALIEGLERYLPRYLPRIGGANSLFGTDRIAAESNEQVVHGGGIEDLRNFLMLAKKQSKTVLVLQHFEKSEIDERSENPGYWRIREVCEQLDIIPFSLEPVFRRSIEGGANPYRDNIHPNEVGQLLIAEAIIGNLPF